MALVRWLHLSDVHECRTQGRIRDRMYDQIVAGVRERCKRVGGPDLVFLTGDLAYYGTPAEYETLEQHFIRPLRAVLPACPLLSVPGNHDVRRERVVAPRSWIGHRDEARLFQAADSLGAAKRTETLLPRFAAYAAFERRVMAWNSDWLASEAGSVRWSDEIGGAKVAVVGTNTAWLCQDDDDWGRLTPGRYLLEYSLDAARSDKPDLLIVLGHHPLGGLAVEGPTADGLRVIERLKQARALYLHGHFHAAGGERIGDARRGVVTVQAPAAFQVHDCPSLRNGLIWGTADLSAGDMFLEPLLWDEQHREYKFDLGAYPECDRTRFEGRDAFRLALPGDRRSAEVGFDPHVERSAARDGSRQLAKTRSRPPQLESQNPVKDCSELHLGVAQGSTPQFVEVLPQLLFGRLRLPPIGKGKRIVEYGLKRAILRYYMRSYSFVGNRLGGTERSREYVVAEAGKWIIKGPRDANGTLTQDPFGSEVLCTLSAKDGDDPTLQLVVCAYRGDIDATVISGQPAETNNWKLFKVFVTHCLDKLRDDSVVLSRASLRWGKGGE